MSASRDMGREELAALLNLLLEAERAGARVLSAWLDQLPAESQRNVDKYAFLDRERNVFVLCGDDARFMNHSGEPNTWEVSESCTLASRDIAAGEEITCDYAAMGPGPLGLDVALSLDEPEALPLVAVAGGGR